MNALAFLDKPLKGNPHPLYALPGEEAFLKRLAREKLVRWLVGDADPAFAVSAYQADDADWSAVRGELDTIPFIGPRRVVILEQADAFVSEHRSALERFLEAPARGVLILDVKKWPATTRLAKALPDAATIVCEPLAAAQLPGWCQKRALAAHGKKLEPSAARMLLERLDPALGLIDQELAKLASFVGAADAIGPADVDALVGRSRTAEVFKIFDAISENRPGEALDILQRLLADGDAPLGILGAFSWQLRMMAQAFRLYALGAAPSQALAQVGVRNWNLKRCEALMRHLGRRRMASLYDWLVETDLGMKGDCPIKDSIQLERLVVKLARSRT